MKLDDFATTAGKAAWRKEAIRGYEDRAILFFRKQFKDLSPQLDDAQLRDVVRLAYNNASDAGIESEQNHWKYLTCVAFWGSYFATDPQYASALDRAGWQKPDGRGNKNRSLPPVLREIDLWVVAARQDIRATQTARHEAFECDGITTHQAALEKIKTVWPKRHYFTDVKEPETMRLVTDRACDKGISREGFASYLLIAMNLGHRFLDDPLYPAFQSFPSDTAVSENAKTAEMRDIASTIVEPYINFEVIL
jgi:hypothetical protein